MANINMTLCSNPEIEVIVDFGSITASTGDVYSIKDEVGNIICASVISRGTPGPFSYTVLDPYDDCDSCTPKSVNQEYTLCVIDCDGNTVALKLPHAVWTNNSGIAVVQLNSVTLGGVNGLNS
jgi:hypothetical protein